MSGTDPMQHAEQTDNPLVSVIVPVYNVEAYVGECLTSIEQQTYPHLQIIVIDDGSTDGSAELCDSHAVHDERIEVVHQANAGLSAARNAGLECACGDFLAFVDSDDVVSPVFIECLLAQNADIAQCTFCTEQSRLILSASACGAFERMSGHEASERLQEDSVGTYTVVWNKLYKRTLFDGVRFPEGRQHEDEFVTYRLLWQADTVATCESPLYYYRSRAESIMGQGADKRNLDAMEALEERVAFYREQGEERLAILTQATLCHRLRAMKSTLEQLPPEQSQKWLDTMDNAYKQVMDSSEVSQRKKLALRAQMISPRLHDLLS